MSIYERAFWRAAGERMMRGAGIGGLLYLGDQFGDVVAAGALNAFDLRWALIGYMLGGALISLLFSLAGNASSGNGPAFNSVEVISAVPESVLDPTVPPRQAPDRGIVPRMRTLRAIGATLATLLFAVGMIFAAPTPAHAAAGDLIIRHSSSSDRTLLTVCKDWGSTSCASGSVRADLARGQSSWWADADGFYLPSGCNAGVSGSIYPPKILSATGWHKLSGAVSGAAITRTVELMC